MQYKKQAANFPECHLVRLFWGTFLEDVGQVFLAICPKTQGRKNSNSRKISQKLKEFFPRKLKKPPNRGKF